MFLRIRRELETTSTFKPIKQQLSREAMTQGALPTLFTFMIDSVKPSWSSIQFTRASGPARFAFDLISRRAARIDGQHAPRDILAFIAEQELDGAGDIIDFGQPA